MALAPARDPLAPGGSSGDARAAYIALGIVAAVTKPGELIRERRLYHGLSQAQLALRAGTTQAAVSRLERDELSPSVATVERLLAVMGEELRLSAVRAPTDWDEAHMRDALRRSPSERLALAISWNRLAGEVAAAGRRARE